MLIVIAYLHFTFPGYLPKNPPLRPHLPPPAVCHNTACMGGPVR